MNNSPWAYTGTPSYGYGSRTSTRSPRSPYGGHPSQHPHPSDSGAGGRYVPPLSYGGYSSQPPSSYNNSGGGRYGPPQSYGGRGHEDDPSYTFGDVSMGRSGGRRGSRPPNTGIHIICDIDSRGGPEPSYAGFGNSSPRRGRSANSYGPGQRLGGGSPARSFGGPRRGGPSGHYGPRSLRNMGMGMGAYGGMRGGLHTIDPEVARQAYLNGPRQGPPPFRDEFHPLNDPRPSSNDENHPRVRWFMQNHTQALTTQEAADQECPICMIPATEHECIKIKDIVGCQHIFGKECFIAWLGNAVENKKLCPLCRKEFLPEVGIWEDDPRLQQMGGTPRGPMGMGAHPYGGGHHYGGGRPSNSGGGHAGGPSDGDFQPM